MSHTRRRFVLLVHPAVVRGRSLCAVVLRGTAHVISLGLVCIVILVPMKKGKNYENQTQA